jgi:PAS domain S-box-containing protein
MKLKLIITILCLLVLTISTFSTVGYYHAARRAALQENHLNSLNILVGAAKRAEGVFRENRQTLARLAGEERLAAALEKPSVENSALARQVLVDFQADSRELVVLLLDRHGQTVVSSHAGSDDQLGGREFFRPYFQQAMRGLDFVFAARAGLGNERAGVFLGQPVAGRGGGEVFGVVAARLSFEKISREIDPDRYSGIIALTGPDDQMFLGPEPANRLFRGRLSGPIPRAGTDSGEVEPHPAVLPEGPKDKRYTIHQYPVISLPGWNLTYLHDDHEYAARLSASLRREIGLFLSFVMVVLGLLVFLLYRLAVREIRGKKELEAQLLVNQHRLEDQVLERTAELRAANKELLLEMAEHRRAVTDLAKSHKTQELLNRILSLALKGTSLQEFLNEFIQQAASYEDLGLLAKGALFLVDEENPDLLVMKAHFGLDQQLQTTCSRVEFGRCLCGRAARDGKVLFANRIDERHDIIYENIMPHGHYCIPILSPDREIVGLYNVYTRADLEHDQMVEDFLITVATALSGIIRLKQATQQLLESEEKHRAITSAAQEAIVMIDHEGKTTFWNPAAARIFGYPEEEALGVALHRLIIPERFNSETDRELSPFVESEKMTVNDRIFELIGRRKDGSEIDLELSLSALRQHSHWTAVGILRDISARKKNEKEKLQLQGQLRQAQKMEAIGTLAGGIAHDFNNILSSILGYAELVREELSPTQAETLNDIAQVIQAGNRAKDLVRQILTFSRQTEEEFVPVQISLIVKEALKLLRASLPSAIEIRQVISDTALTVFADPSQIHQVLMNLCTNAFKAMREKGGILEVRLESFVPDREFAESYPDLRANRYVVMVVSDTGIGMDSSIIPRIFEPYFSTNKKEDGTGLGLAVVHGIVNRLGGAIEVASNPGLGSTFKIYLPVLESLEPPVEQPSFGLLPSGSERILLVDDELPILELGRRMLTSLGYEVVLRTSSIEALELFRNQSDKFDLVITDLNMPNMTGTRLADAMTEIRPDIPIILCTGYADLSVGQHSRGRSIREILMKPIAKSQLATMVRQVLDDPAAQN